MRLAKLNSKNGFSFRHFNGCYIWLTILLLLLSIYFYYETIFYFPSHIHAWTQSDRFSIALQFLENGFNLFKPQTHNLTTFEGVTGVDLPLNEFFVAISMKIFNTEAPLIFRLYTLLLSIVGYFYLFRLSKLLTHHNLSSMAIVVFVYTCPVITYYQAGFIPSSGSFALLLMAYYYYFTFLQKGEINSFYICIILVTLAALSRMPFNIYLFAILLHQIIYWIQKRKIEHRQLFAFAVAYLIIIAYTYYKNWLNVKYGSQFLTSLMPAQSFTDFFQMLQVIYTTWTFQLFTIYHYLLLGLASISIGFAFFKIKTLPTFIKNIGLHGFILVAGFIVYFSLMEKQFLHHEYYFIDSFYTAIIIWLIVSFALWQPYFNISKLTSFALSTILIFMLMGATVESKKIQKLKYAETLWDRGEITRKNFIESANFLDSLNISNHSKILVLDAYSTNAPLILMKRKGYTVLDTKSKILEEALTLDFDYVVTQDVFFPSDIVYNYPSILNRLKRLGGNGKISVYQLRKVNQKATLAQQLGIVQPTTEYILNFDTVDEKDATQRWQKVAPLTQVNSYSKPNAMAINKTTIFGPTFEVSASQIEHPFNKILFEGYFNANQKITKVLMVAQTIVNNQTAYYASYPIKTNVTNQWVKYQCLFALPAPINSLATFKCYLWNTNEDALQVDDFKVTLYYK